MRKYILSIGLALICSFMWWACSKDAGVSPASDTGKSGSLARFAIVGNFMYTASEYNVKIYNISTPIVPQFIATTRIGWGVETMFAYGKNLFLGSRNGVYMYEIQSDGTIVYKSYYQHFNTCDPVVADGSFAYSTIRSGWDCRVKDSINELQILDVSDIKTPKLLSTVKMTFPIGLGVNGNDLFVCDKEGVRILDVTDRTKPKEVHYLKNIDAVDVIVLDKHLLIIGKENLTQVSYKDRANPTVVSTLSLK